MAIDDGLAADIRAATAELRDDTVAFLARLVAEDSTLGREAGAQDVVAEAFAGLGLEIDRFEVDPVALADRPGFSPPVHDTYAGRDNVVGVHRPKAGGGRSLILNSHVDVVPPGPAAAWTTPPFTPSVRDGRLYGRGGCDMKAGTAAYLAAMKALAALGLQPAAEVILQSVIEEECTGNGALACLARGYRADAAVIPEPFGQTLLTAQLGVMWATIELAGRPAHVLDTSAGRNAIEAAYAVFAGLKRLEAAWNAEAVRHPAWAGHPHPVNFNLGRLRGGDWASTVPPTATMDVRVGFFPGVPLADVRDAIETTVRGVAASDPALAGITLDVVWCGFQAEGCVIDPTSPMMRTLAAAHTRVTGTEARTIASTATTDVRFFALYGGMPATCYGPTGDNMHAIDEWVSIDSMMEVAAVLATFVAEWCGVEPR